MTLSPRRWMLLLALLAAGAHCQHHQVQHLSATTNLHDDSKDVQEDADADDASEPYNTTAYASHKCGRYGYMYEEGGDYSYDRFRISEYGRLNDLKSTCKSRASNARGSYTSKGLCYFAFHAIPDDKVPSNRMSVACSDANLEDESKAIKDDPVGYPVRSWADTCVGDFPRCYKLDRDIDEHVVLKFICSKKLEVPAGATHLSVDCTADKAALKKMLKNGELDENADTDPYMRHQVKERREYYAFIVALAISACACCFFCLLLVHRYAFKPYLKALKRTRSDPELAGLTSSDADRTALTSSDSSRS